MPLIRNEAGEPVGAQCINKCGELARLDQRVAIVIPGEEYAPQGMTILICPVCQYCEWYYGEEEEEEEDAQEETAEGVEEVTAEPETAEGGEVETEAGA